MGYVRGRAKLADSIMNVVDSWIEILNEAGSAYFIFSTLRNLSDKTLYVVSLAFLAFNVFARIFIGLRNLPHVNDGHVTRADLDTGYLEKRIKTGESQQLQFFLGVIVFIFEPSSGRKMINATLKKTKSSKNSDGTTHDMHPLALHMLTLYLSARNEIMTSLSITICADLPELAVELAFFFLYAQAGGDFSFWFSIAGTVAHLTRQGFEINFDVKHIQSLKVSVNVSR